MDVIRSCGVSDDCWLELWLEWKKEDEVRGRDVSV